MRPLRAEYPGAVFHAYNRGVNRADIFFCDEDRLLFLALLAEAVRRFHWVIHQFTLMTNHFLSSRAAATRVRVSRRLEASRDRSFPRPNRPASRASC